MNPDREIIGYVTATDGLLQHVGITNDVGGSSDLPPGRYRVRVIRSWYDYETGQRCVGELLDEADRKVAVEAGTTGFGPREPEPNNIDPELDALLLDSYRNRDRRVYFDARQFEEERP